MRNKKIGIFDVSKKMILQFPKKELDKIFKNIIIIHAEDYIRMDCVRYTAMGEKFEIVKEGELIPEYRLDIQFKHTHTPGKNKGEGQVRTTINAIEWVKQ